MASLPPLLIDLPRNPVFAVGIPTLLGIGTGIATNKGKYGPESLYEKSLTKPPYSPPKQAFGIVWPALFAAMGYGSHLIVKSLDKTPPGFGRQRANKALQLYYAQLVLNQVWTPIRFGFGQLGLAFIDLAALTTTLGYWLYETKDVSKKAFWLNVPYFLWASYATYLSGATWWLNGGEPFVKASFNKIVGSVKTKGKGKDL